MFFEHIQFSSASPSSNLFPSKFEITLFAKSFSCQVQFVWVSWSWVEFSPAVWLVSLSGLVVLKEMDSDSPFSCYSCEIVCPPSPLCARILSVWGLYGSRLWVHLCICPVFLENTASLMLSTTSHSSSLSVLPPQRLQSLVVRSLKPLSDRWKFSLLNRPHARWKCWFSWLLVRGAASPGSRDL